MFILNQIDRMIENYKKEKITRPRYKIALFNKKITECIIHDLTKQLNRDFLDDEQKKDLEVKIKKLSSLLYYLELYIIECKIIYKEYKNERIR